MTKEHIFYGPWINWEHGPIQGATLTLGDRSGALLVAFIAFWVTLVGAQLFKILAYSFHQIRSKSSAQDGLYHQQQIIFRNTPTPGGAAWSFLQQGWSWNGKAKGTFLRTLPWALFCLTYMLLFAVCAVFSSEITKGPGAARLIVSDNCGYWEQRDFGAVGIRAYGQRTSNQSIASTSYARQCYSGQEHALGCSKFFKPSLKYTSNDKAQCPFAAGMCSTGDFGAYEVQTSKIDTLYDLGINSRKSDRMQIQKTLTCAPLEQKDFVTTSSGLAPYEGDTIYRYNYGGSEMSGKPVPGLNYTYEYNDHNAILSNFGYQLGIVSHSAGDILPFSSWAPKAQVNRSDADISLIFVSQNSVVYQEKVEDPFFKATEKIDVNLADLGLATTISSYRPDNYVSVMGCVDQYSFCNTQNNFCTPAMGIYQMAEWIAFNNGQLNLNAIQRALAIRLIKTIKSSGVDSIVATLGENAIAAKDFLSRGTQSAPLPNNQWQIEIEGWFDKGLADLQIQIVEYATGPPIIPEGSYIYKSWEDNTLNTTAELSVAAVDKAMCYSQMVNDTTDTVSFSITGMVILFAIGGIINFISLFIDTIVGWIQKKTGKGNHARMCWLLDDKLQLHRYLNQELGQGQWSVEPEAMPVTVAPQEFNTLAVAHEKAYKKPEYQQTAQPRWTEETFPGYQASTAYQSAGQTQAQPNYPKYTKVTTREETFLPK